MLASKRLQAMIEPEYHLKAQYRAQLAAKDTEFAPSPRNEKSKKLHSQNSLSKSSPFPAPPTPLRNCNSRTGSFTNAANT